MPYFANSMPEYTLLAQDAGQDAGSGIPIRWVTNCSLLCFSQNYYIFFAGHQLLLEGSWLRTLPGRRLRWWSDQPTNPPTPTSSWQGTRGTRCRCWPAGSREWEMEWRCSVTFGITLAIWRWRLPFGRAKLLLTPARFAILFTLLLCCNLPPFSGMLFELIFPGRDSAAGKQRFGRKFEVGVVLLRLGSRLPFPQLPASQVQTSFYILGLRLDLNSDYCFQYLICLAFNSLSSQVGPNRRVNPCCQQHGLAWKPDVPFFCIISVLNFMRGKVYWNKPNENI